MVDQHYWQQQAQQLLWRKPFDSVCSGSMAKGDVRWFDGGQLNVSENCIDRHLAKHADKTAILWVGDEPGIERRISFKQLHLEVCHFSNVLKSRGVKKGDRICIYMPMIPEAAFAMLACARLGAIHTVVFAGFSTEALQKRIIDADCCCVVTADGGRRGGRLTKTKDAVDQALKGCPHVHSCIVVKHTDQAIDWHVERDVDYFNACRHVSDQCLPEPMESEDPLFVLYTSGSTGKPKGVLHTTAGYLLYASHTHRLVFDLKPDDVYWCTADIGWITGHSYIVYGPLANGTTTVMFEGVPTYPNPDRCWQIVDQYNISIFYTAPTAIRALRASGDQWLAKTNRKSLRLLGTVGEPINPEAWQWYFERVGQSRCCIVDTWWQTETGGILIAPLDKAPKPGAAMQPLPGIELALLDGNGNQLFGEAAGDLVVTAPWPGMMRTVYGDHQRFIDTYLTAFSGSYQTGDGARRDVDGDYWITGRVDDVLNISGHRIGTAEVESALVLQREVAEAAVVGLPHAIKGESMMAFVMLMPEAASSDTLKQQLIQAVRQEIGAIATLETITFVIALPKTRSGKIMRRILRKIASGDTNNFGDTSTLANPECLVDLIPA